MIVMMQPHTGADDFQKIDDAERPIALVRAQFAMIGMIDRDQRIDAGCFGRQKLLLLQGAAVLRQCAQVVSLQPDRRLPQVDDFDAGQKGMNRLLLTNAVSCWSRAAASNRTMKIARPLRRTRFCGDDRLEDAIRWHRQLRG